MNTQFSQMHQEGIDPPGLASKKSPQFRWMAPMHKPAYKWAWRSKPTLPATKIVLCCLAWFSKDDSFICRLTSEQIAEHCGFTHAATLRAIELLSMDGLIAYREPGQAPGIELLAGGRS